MGGIRYSPELSSAPAHRGAERRGQEAEHPMLGDSNEKRDTEFDGDERMQ